MTAPLPPLPADLEPTRAALHGYALAVGAVPRAHGLAHPRWWHISLGVRPDGFATRSVPLPDGRSLGIRIDPRRHLVVFEASDGPGPAIDMRDGMTPAEMGDRIIDIASGYGLDGPFDRARFADHAGAAYDPAHAANLFSAFVAADRLLTEHRAGLSGAVGPIQVWPHGFDIAFEWFGTRTVEHEEQGEMVTSPAQINLGWYPAGDAYFYSNPWPFDRALLAVALPAPGRWHVDGWEGSMLRHDDVAGDPDGPATVLRFARAVHAAAAPGLGG